MKIDCENKLSEKKAKELSTSLNYLVNNIIDVLLKKNVEKGSFKIKFDNDSVFSIITFKEKVFVSYVDKYQKKKEMLSLQDALNINKYARDIEYQLLQIDNNHVIKAFYTEQNIEKLIAIFAEKEPLLRQLDKEYHFSIKNTKTENYYKDSDDMEL